MPPVQLNASIAATGLGVRYIGDWAYAYSGATSVSNTELTCLEFTTNAGIWVPRWEMHYSDGGDFSGDDMAFFMYFNDLGIIVYNVTSAGDAKQPDIELIIPPLTKVTVRAKRVAGSTVLDVYASLTGRVYGAK